MTVASRFFRIWVPAGCRFRCIFASLWGSYGAYLGIRWVSFGYLLGGFLDYLGSFGNLLGALLNLLGAFWESLRLPWGSFKAFWEPFGIFWVPFGNVPVALGPLGTP